MYSIIETNKEECTYFVKLNTEFKVSYGNLKQSLNAIYKIRIQIVNKFCQVQKVIVLW